MPVMDEFKEARETIKNASFKEKLKYFGDYYKIHTIVVLVIAALGITLIHDIVTQKDDALFVAMINSASWDEEQTSQFKQKYADYAAIDMNEYDVLIDNTINFSTSATDEFSANVNELSMSSSERLMVYTAAGELDAIVGNSEFFPNQAYQGMFHDMRDILTEEQIAKYEPYFYYIDQSYLEALEEAQEALATGQEIDENLGGVPDPAKPEDMEEPIPVGIFVHDCNTLTDTYVFGGDYAALGVMVNAPHVENSLKFIDYLFE